MDRWPDGRESEFLELANERGFQTNQVWLTIGGIRYPGISVTIGDKDIGDFWEELERRSPLNPAN